MKLFTELLSTPTAQLGRVRRFIVFQLKLWPHCVSLLKKNRANQQAAALAYRTIFGIVPLAIVVLLIFQSFPAYQEVGGKLKDIVYRELHFTTIEYTDPVNPGETIVLTKYLDDIVTGFFVGMSKGSITIASAILVIWAALSLLSTIEKAFNNIWHVATGRSLIRRVINYWAILTLGPLLLGAGIYITTKFALLDQIQRTALSYLGSAILSCIIATAAFFVLYLVLPNTRVQIKPAIWAAAVAGIAWTLTKWGFGRYVTGFMPYFKIYGVLGLVPLGVFWIYVTWLIVLFGLQLTFTTQNLRTLDEAEMASARKAADCFIANDITVINIARQIADAFENNEAPISQELICSRLDIPGHFGAKILTHLVNKGLIARTSEPRIGFIPVKEPRNITLSDIADAVAAAAFAQGATDQSQKLRQLTDAQRELLSRYSLIDVIATEREA